MIDFNELVDDLTSLEVATLTNKIEPLSLVKTAEGVDTTLLKPLTDAVEAARKKLITELKGGDKALIKTARKVLRETKKQLSESEKALGLFDPKDIFSTIRTELKNADLVAYSRFELEGDSINFFNNDSSVQNLVDLHHFMVGASQEARKSLFNAAFRSKPDKNNV